MKRVIIESPFAGDIERNKAYAFQAALDALSRGESPFSSHIFYPQFLDELDLTQRNLGIAAGFAWWESADLIAFYTDLGWSPGMCKARERCVTLSKQFEIRSVRPIQ
jgi:hypothetical protein